MATTTPAQIDATADGDQCVVLRDVGWNGYRSILRLRRGRPRPRMVYLDGDLYLMSPSHTHERRKERLGAFVLEVVVGLEIPCIFSGSTTYRRRKQRGGVEPDQSYYLTNAPRVLGLDKRINLRTDPPPDLTIEVVHSHDADAAVEVSRRLGVPEVWVADDVGFHILALQAAGHYREVATSVSFPFLAAAEVHDWLRRMPDEDDTTWVRAVRRWVEATLIPRARQAGIDPQGGA